MNSQPNSLHRVFYLLIACAILLGVAIAPPMALAQSMSGFTYNGYAHVSFQANEYNTAAGTTSRQVLASTHANWTALLVTQYQTNATATSIAATSNTPTDASLITAIQELHNQGIKVMLKPHVDAISGEWRGTFQPSNVDTWFASYTTFITHYATLARQNGVEGLVIGTEYKLLSGSNNLARWTAVINAVRNAFPAPGIITYAANAVSTGDEFTSVSFWEQLDLIGLDSYYRLTNITNPTIPQLVSAWTANSFGENGIAMFQNVANAHPTKPMIFTEIGYRSVDGANEAPFDFSAGSTVDQGEQRDCAEAMFQVWSTHTNFMKGLFWWDWSVPVPGANDTDYTPRGKLAQTTMTTWFGNGTTANFTLTPNPASVTVNQGSTATSTISIARTSFTSAVTLSTSALPNGVTASFNPNNTTGNSSVLTFTASATATVGGPVAITITGTGGGITRTTTVNLTVAQVATPNFTLTPSPTSVTVNQGSTATSTISIARTNFTSALTLSTSALPTGVTASFNPNNTTGNSSVLTFTASATATLGGPTAITITGTGGGLTRTTTVNLTVAQVATPNFTLTPSPTSLTVNQGASGTSTISIARTNFTSAVTLSASGLPTGVTAGFNPNNTTGNSSVLTLTASATATVGGPVTVTITGTGGGLTRTTTVALTVASGTTGTGGVTVTPVVSSNSGFFNEEDVKLANTGALTALSVTIVVQRTTGVSFSGQYNTIGGTITQGNSSTAAAVTYTFTLNAGQTLGVGNNWTFAAQTSGTGTVHPTAGDTWTVTYTTGGQNFSQTGHF